MNIKFTIVYLFCILLILIFLNILNCLSQTLPSTSTYQGLLTDASAKPVNDGIYLIEFNIYDKNGTKVWTETQSVQTIKGFFSVLLGTINPLPIPFPNGAELETVMNGNAMKPRTKLSGVPWALDLARNFVAAVKANGNIITHIGDTVNILSGNNIVISPDIANHSITISAGGNPSSITGIQAGKYLSGGGTTGIVTLSLAIPLDIHENISNDLVTSANDGSGIAIVGSAHGSGSAGLFEIVPPGNTSDALHAETNGTGSAGLFEIKNTNSVTSSIIGQTDGSGAAVLGTNTGMGYGGWFNVTNANNPSASILVSTIGTGSAGSFFLNNNLSSAAAINDSTNGVGPAIHAVNYGGGSLSGSGANAGIFEVTNLQNGSSALIAQTMSEAGNVNDFGGSLANASEFNVSKKKGGSAVHASSSSYLPTIYAWNVGIGSAGYFTSYGSYKSPTLHIVTPGGTGNGVLSEHSGDAGSAGVFIDSSAKNNSSALFAATMLGGGSAIEGHGGKNGYGGIFSIDTLSNNRPALLSTTLGGGSAIEAHGGLKGNAGIFAIDSFYNDKPALLVRTNGYNSSVGARIESINPSDTGATLDVYTKANGNAAYFYKDSSKIFMTSAAIRVINAAEGEGGVFDITGGDFNMSPAIAAHVRKGKGSAIYAETTDTTNEKATLSIYNHGAGTTAEFYDLSGRQHQIATLVVDAGIKTNTAGSFMGSVSITGDLTVYGKILAGIKDFKIDHPLDPENKYLVHASVESPEMKTIYDGITQLDLNGEAWIELPGYFEALNESFRYQLTSVGAPSPNLYVAVEITNNRFKISGGTLGAKVSWQVTGIRKDAFAQSHKFIPEEEKEPENKGKFLFPVEIGKSEKLRIGYREKLSEIPSH